MYPSHRFMALLMATIGATAPAASAEDAAATVSVDLPVETAHLQPGPGVDTATAACLTCHSVDYVYMQPPLTRDQWRGEVLKMKNVFGAPFPENQVDAIVAYLVSQNGSP